MTLIIDISHHKGKLNWHEMAKLGVIGAFAKTSDGFLMPPYPSTSLIDNTFEHNFKSTKEFTMRGGYHFIRLGNETLTREGQKDHLGQMKVFYDECVRNGLQDSDIITVDIEENKNDIAYLNPVIVAERAMEAVEYAEELFGREVLIYTAAWWWNDFGIHFRKSFLKSHLFWIANYFTPRPEYGNGLPNWLIVDPRYGTDQNRNKFPLVPYGVPLENVVMWQYSEYGSLNEGAEKYGSHFDLNLPLYDLQDKIWNRLRIVKDEPIHNIFDRIKRYANWKFRQWKRKLM